MSLPTIRVDRNSACVTVGENDYYFSYQTIVAFRSPQHGLVCSENIWSVTTGKHLNEIESDKTSRVKHSEFIRLLNEATEPKKAKRLLG